MPCTYAPESYNTVLRWTADTTIKYKENPKLVGSKSHVRYAKYAKAKTVGEALKLGSYSLDLLFDFEKGHLVSTGGPVRKEPLLPKDKEDSWTKTDKILAGMHQKWLTWKATFEVADRLGVDRRNLSADKLGGESVETHAHRMEAQAVAQLILAEADRSKRKITERDVVEVLRLWGFKKSTSRQNVMKEGIEWVNSDTLGLLASYDGNLLISNSTKHYPAVPALFSRWLRDNLPAELGGDFAFTSINVNKGYAARRHRDGNNEGPSFIKSFGSYEGGGLRYWPEDNKHGNVDNLEDSEAVEMDLRKNLLLFDGNRAHEVGDFSGERFTLVWFCVGRSYKATAEQRKKLQECGIVVPTEKDIEWAKALLAAPRGYGKAQLPPANDGKQPLRHWTVKAPKGPSVFESLSQEKVEEAKKASRQVECPEDDDDAPEETGFAKHRFDRLTRDDGRKVFRLFLIGASGRPHLALEGVETRPHSAHFEYRKREGFPFGSDIRTHRLAEVRVWMQEILDQHPAPSGKAKAEGKKRAAEGGDEAPKAKRSKSKGGEEEASTAMKVAGKSPVEQALRKLGGCSEKTKVVFRPANKVPDGSKPKSAERYGKYCKAKTLGAALDLGCTGQDLVHDLQQGLLTVQGGKSAKGKTLAMKASAMKASETTDRLGKLLQQWQRAAGKQDVAAKGG